MGTNEQNEKRSGSEENEPEDKQNLKKKKAGRKAKWSETMVDDMVDIIVNNERFTRMLIFTNTPNQRNGVIYESVLQELKERCLPREENVPFNIGQMRTKFKKLVSECKKVAMTIKTVTGVKRFIDEKGYGSWFNKLYILVKTRDSCQPGQSVEPSAEDCINEGEHHEDKNNCNGDKEMFVPIKPVSKKKKKNEQINEALTLMKSFADNDPTKSIINFLTTEMEKSRDHELRIMQAMFSSPTAFSNGQQTASYQQQTS